MKYYGSTWDYILWGIDYVNLGLLAATIPSYKKDDEMFEDSAASMASMLNNESKLEQALKR